MRFSKNKVILTGYRATGKSSIGQKLASLLDMEFLDMDKIIEERQGCSIREMVAEQGWDFFRSKEKQLLEELVSKSDIVIATGGGAILHQDMWQKLKETGLAVWLSADEETICKRLASDALTEEQRPSLTGQDIQKEISDVLAEREPLYRAGSHLTIDTSKKSVDEIVETIKNALSSNNS